MFRRLVYAVILAAMAMGMLGIKKDVNQLYQRTIDLRMWLRQIETNEISYLPDMVELITPSVVLVKCGGTFGSGVIITPDGWILTAKHVLRNVDKVDIVLNDKREFKAASWHMCADRDVGLIKIDVSEDLPFSSLGNSAVLRIGKKIFIIGSPYGSDNFNSLNVGHVSGLNREYSRFVDDWILPILQLDVAGNPGTSGCPVFDAHGNIVGIVVGGYGRGITFAVPISMVEPFISDILSNDQEAIKIGTGVVSSSCSER